MDQINDHVLRHMDLKEILAVLKEAQNTIKISIIKTKNHNLMEPQSFEPYPLEFGEKLKINEEEQIPKSEKFCLIRKLSTPRQLCSHEYVVSSRKESLKAMSDRIEERTSFEQNRSEFSAKNPRLVRRESDLRSENTFNVYDQIEISHKECESQQPTLNSFQSSNQDRTSSIQSQEHKMKMIPIKEIRLESCDNIFNNSARSPVIPPQNGLKKSDSFKCDQKALNKEIDSDLEDKKINVLKYLQSVEFQGTSNRLKKARSNMSLTDRIAYFNRL